MEDGSHSGRSVLGASSVLFFCGFFVLSWTSGLLFSEHFGECELNSVTDIFFSVAAPVVICVFLTFLGLSSSMFARFLCGPLWLRSRRPWTRSVSPHPAPLGLSYRSCTPTSKKNSAIFLLTVRQDSSLQHCVWSKPWIMQAGILW